MTRYGPLWLPDGLREKPPTHPSDAMTDLATTYYKRRTLEMLKRKFVFDDLRGSRLVDQYGKPLDGPRPPKVGSIAKFRLPIQRGK